MRIILLSSILLIVLAIAGCAGPQVSDTPSPGIATTSSPINNGQGFSAQDPAPVNSPVTFHELVNDSGQGNADQSATLTLLEVLRGTAALEKIQHSYPSYLINIQSDREFMLARFKYELADTNPSGVSHLVNRGSFEISRNGAFDPTDNAFIMGATPDFYGRVKKGGSVDGWIAFTVPKTASSPLIVFERQSAGNGGIWFKAS